MSKTPAREPRHFGSDSGRGHGPAARMRVDASPTRIDTAPNWSGSPRQSRQQAQIAGLASAAPRHLDAPAQLSGGSSRANEELVKGMGKGGQFVDKPPKAKPHTGTGGGKSRAEAHQARNEQVINKAKRDTMRTHSKPTMFQDSQMRTAEKAPEKAAKAQEVRSDKKKKSKDAEMERIAEYWGTTADALTADEIKQYRKMESNV